MEHRSAPLIAFRPGFYSQHRVRRTGVWKKRACTDITVRLDTPTVKRCYFCWFFSFFFFFYQIFPKCIQVIPHVTRKVRIEMVTPRLVNITVHVLSTARSHQRCIGSFLITCAVSRDTGWWIMALTGPHLGDVSLVFLSEMCRWLYTNTEPNTNSHTERKMINKSTTVLGNELTINYSLRHVHQNLFYIKHPQVSIGLL